MRNRIVITTAAGVGVLLATGTGFALANTPQAAPAAASSAAVAPPAAGAIAIPVSTAGAPSSITVEEARSIASAHIGGGRVVKVEREYEHGRMVWEVEIVKGSVGYKVEVDQVTGQVTRTKVD